MKVDLCDIKRMLRSEFFAKDRDITLQVNRYFFHSTGQRADVPPGAIVLMFSGAVVDIPTGWQLADGTNGTTDLRNMFVVGAGDTYNPGDTGGALTHTHGDGSYAAANDTHNHDVTGTSGSDSHSHVIDSVSNHQHGSGTLSTGVPSATTTWGNNNTPPGPTKGDGTHTHSVTAGITGANGGHNHGGSTQSDSHDHGDGTYAAANDTHGHDVTGTSAAANGLPPYYALCFIMRPT